jgi:hypothetical protein
MKPKEGRDLKEGGKEQERTRQGRYKTRQENVVGV